MAKFHDNNKYLLLEKLFMFDRIEEKVYEDYENDSSFIVRIPLSENKYYSIVYDTLNDSRYVHFLEFFRNLSERRKDDEYQTHRSQILMEDY